MVLPDLVVIAGHARLLAARKLGVTEVPVIELSGLSEVQCRALAIEDNQLAIIGAGWDEEQLRIGTGCASGRGLPPEDVVLEPPSNAVTVAGEVWLCGPHRVLCGDATPGKLHGANYCS